MGFLSPTGSRLLSFVALLIFGFGTWLFGVQIVRAFHSKNWPVVHGVVFAFYQTPQYRYSVSGKVYTNDVVSCNELCNRHLAINNSAKYAVRYPLQADVIVHYLPSGADVSVLETNFDRSLWWIIVGFCFFDILLLAAFVFGWTWRLGRSSI